MGRASNLAALLARRQSRRNKLAARGTLHALTVAGFARCHTRWPGAGGGVVVAHAFPERTTREIAGEWRGLGVTCLRCLRVRAKPAKLSERETARARRTVRT